MEVNAQRHILLAEDDADDREIFRQALEVADSAVVVATVDDGDDVLPKLRAYGDLVPEVVFLDINMPKKSGLECLAEIMADVQLKNLRVVMLSTSANPENIEESYRAGAAFYAIKPHDFNSLTKIIRTVLSHDPQARVAEEAFVIDFNPPGLRQLYWLP